MLLSFPTTPPPTAASGDSLDWQDSATPESIAQRVIGKVKPGSIVLFHNDAEYTPQALPVILEELSKQGYTFEYVSDLIYQDNYQIDHTGMQVPTMPSVSFTRRS